MSGNKSSVCQKLTDPDFIRIQEIGPDGVNIIDETCVYLSRFYLLQDFNCCKEHQEALSSLFRKEILAVIQRLKHTLYRAHIICKELENLKGNFISITFLYNYYLYL